jgi:hypothetical protein
VSNEADRVLYGLLLDQPRRPGDETFRQLLLDSQMKKIQSRDAKVELRRQLDCPPYPPPPGVPDISKD